MNALTLDHFIGQSWSDALMSIDHRREDAWLRYMEECNHLTKIQDDLCRHALISGTKQIRIEAFAVDETEACRPCGGTGKDRGNNAYHHDVCTSCLGSGFDTVLAIKEVTAGLEAA